MIDWQWCALHELPARRLYALLAARQAVFIIEQACVYPDLDGRDENAEHLVGWSGEEVAACLRLLAPGAYFAECSLGRILTTSAFRGGGLGRELVLKGLARAYERYPDHAVRIGAQLYLEKFYRSLGFEPVSEPYVEDGIPHIEMLHRR